MLFSRACKLSLATYNISCVSEMCTEHLRAGLSRSYWNRYPHCLERHVTNGNNHYFVMNFEYFNAFLNSCLDKSRRGEENMPDNTRLCICRIQGSSVNNPDGK